MICNPSGMNTNLVLPASCTRGSMNMSPSSILITSGTSLPHSALVSYPPLANSFPLVTPWGNVMYRELCIRFVMDLSTLMDLVVCKSSKLERVAIFSGYLELHSHGASKPRLANSFGLMALRMREVGSGASVVHMRGCGRVHRQTTCVWSTWRVVRISRTEDLDGFSYDLYATMVVRVSRTIHPSHGSTSLEVA